MTLGRAPDRPAPRGHPVFAALYEPLGRRFEEKLIGPLRRQIVSPARGRVLEVGLGTGLNLPYYGVDADLVATEPDPYMLRRARRRAAARGQTVDLHAAPGEALPFPDASFDAVVFTLVLCSVADPARALDEARRVLRPTGTLHLVEHVRGEGLHARAQDLITPLWRRLGAGCHPNRPTLETVRAAGFDLEHTDVHYLPIPGPIVACIARPR